MYPTEPITVAEIGSLLDEFLTLFVAEVLAPLEITHGEPLLKTELRGLPSGHPFWKWRRRIVRLARERVSWLLTEKPQCPDYPDYGKALLGGYLDDLVNLFVREVLGERGLLNDRWDDTIFEPTHVYRRRRDNFICLRGAEFIDGVLGLTPGVPEHTS